MPVNLIPAKAADLFAIPGLDLGWAEAGIKKPNRKDLLVLRLAPGAQVGGVFTTNRFCAAPVQVCQAHLAAGSAIRALVINTGNANAGTGEPGLAAARRTCDALAQLIGCDAAQVLPFSTGVILEPLPVDRVVAGLPQALGRLAPDHWLQAAEAIMTTDTVPKAVSRRVTFEGRAVTITGISKGAGMIHPNMATMLGFVATDAGLAPGLAAGIARHAADRSFNRITIDGDTSTNDSFIVMATGAGALHVDGPGAALDALTDAITAVSLELAQMIVRDGEGATKFIAVTVEGARDEAEALRVAHSVALSPLVKTAFFASDPNLGRILAAVGKAGVGDLDQTRVQLWLDDVRVARDGGRDPDYREQDGQRVMKQAEIGVRVALGRGSAATTVWTTDFSHDYVSINADYRS